MPLLSPRETQTLQLLADGKCPKEIACIMGITMTTVYFYSSQARKKLQQPTTHAAVALAIYLQLIVKESPFNSSPCEN